MIIAISIAERNKPMTQDPNQYTPLTSSQVITYFQEVKVRIELLEQTISNILRLNDLKYQEEPKRRGKLKDSAMAKRPIHDDVEEDKAMINKAIAKHDAKEHPGHKPTTIKKGGRPVPKPSAKKAGRGR